MVTTPLGQGTPVVAFDVGGTNLKAAIVDETGQLVDTVRVRTPHSVDGSGDAVLHAIERVWVGISNAPVTPTACGLLVAGLVDDDSGIGVYSENLGWRDVPFRSLMEQLIGLPVAFGHDVRGAGEAEYRVGAAADYRDVVILVIGTGISGAIYLDGRLHVGNGYAGEFGHSVIDPNGPDCECGGHGCLEAIASAGAIARRSAQASRSDVTGAKEVLTKVHNGDHIAKGVWESALDALALSLAQTTAALAPEAIVIGGGLSEAGDALFAPLAARLDNLLTFHRRPALLPAALGQNAGLIGAALRARDLAARP